MLLVSSHTLPRILQNSLSALLSLFALFGARRSSFSNRSARRLQNLWPSCFVGSRNFVCFVLCCFLIAPSLPNSAWLYVCGWLHYISLQQQRRSSSSSRGTSAYVIGILRISACAGASECAYTGVCVSVCACLYVCECVSLYQACYLPAACFF